MERCPPQPMTPFDMMVSSPQLQTMKLMLPYLPPAYQRILALYIKFTELQNTFRHFSFLHTASGKHSATPFDILDEIRPYMNPKDSESLESFLSILNMMEMMKDMNGGDMPDFSNMTEMSEMPDVLNMMQMFHTDPPDMNFEQKEGDNNHD